MNAATYPKAPGFKAPGTSQEAADSERGRAPVLRERVLALLQNRDATADECAAMLQETVLAVRPRLSELRKPLFGKPPAIEDSGVRRENKSGKRAVVWRVTRKAGQQELAL